jgi:hypothetical protein
MLVARVSPRGSSTMRCAPAACGAAEAPVFVDVFASDELLDDFGAEETVGKLSFVRFCWSKDGLFIRFGS